MLDTWHCISEQRAQGETRRADERVDGLAVEAAVAGAARDGALPKTHLPWWQTADEAAAAADELAEEAAEAAAAAAAAAAQAVAPHNVDHLHRRVSQQPLARGARGLHAAPPPLPPPLPLGAGPSFEGSCSVQSPPLGGAPPPAHEPREPPWWPSREPQPEGAAQEHAQEHGLARSTPLAPAAAAASGAAFEVAWRAPGGADADADAERLGRLLHAFLEAYSRRAPLRVHDTFAPAGRRGANLGDGAFNFETVAKIFRQRLGQLQRRSCLSALIDGWPRDGLLRSSEELSRLLHVEDASEESWETPRKKSRKPLQKQKKQTVGRCNSRAGRSRFS